jgi:cytochrome P450
LCLEAVQKKEKYYENSTEFNPDRWEEVDISEAPFFAFGYSTRNCFGRKFAILEMKSILFHLLQKYELLDNSSDHPLSTELEFGCVPVGKVLPILLKPITN